MIAPAIIQIPNIIIPAMKYFIIVKLKYLNYLKVFMCEADQELIKQLEQKNQDLREINSRLQEYNVGLTQRYSETMSMFDDAIHILSTVRYQRKLDKILEKGNETPTDSV